MTPRSPEETFAPLTDEERATTMAGIRASAARLDNRHMPGREILDMLFTGHERYEATVVELERRVEQLEARNVELQAMCAELREASFASVQTSAVDAGEPHHSAEDCSDEPQLPASYQPDAE